MTVVVTNCTKRKRFEAPPELRAARLAPGHITDLAKGWMSRVAATPAASTAEGLYSGRSFEICRQAAATAEAEFLIISAGLGLVRSDELVPAYDLTVTSGSPDNVLARTSTPATAAGWWRALRATGAAGLVEWAASVPEKRGPFLIALPTPYLRMIETELSEIPEARRSNIRVFTAPSFQFSDSRLQSCVMPYDRRMDGPDSPRLGTATDFAARCLDHFATRLLPAMPGADAESHREAVGALLKGWRYPARPKRQWMADDELLAVIREEWSDAGSSFSRMLSHVRYELGLACEYGRMKRLFSIVSDEMAIAP